MYGFDARCRTRTRKLFDRLKFSMYHMYYEILKSQLPIELASAMAKSHFGEYLAELLAMNANVESTDKDGHTALMKAAGMNLILLTLFCKILVRNDIDFFF